jgi:hypothetical protein
MSTDPAWFAEIQERRALERRRMNVKTSPGAKFKRAGAAPKSHVDAVGTVKISIALSRSGRGNANVKGNLHHRLLVAEAKVSAVMAAVEAALFE